MAIKGFMDHANRGLTTLPATAKGLYLYTFANAAAGGTLFITYSSSDFSSSGTIALKVG